MNKKFLIVYFGALFLVMTLSLPKVYARHDHPRADYGDNLGQMFFKKAHLIKESREELGLPEDKAEAVKNLELETKKTLIKQDAGIEVVSLDIMAKLHDYPVDVEAVNKLMDQKYELKKAEARSLVEAIAKLKGTLTKDQYEKLRKLWKAREKEEHNG